MRRLRDVLAIDVPDPEIIAYAAAHEWVVFTSDVRFLSEDDKEHEEETIDCGVVFYRQAESPSPGDVVAALRVISRHYEEYTDINTYVPDDWI